MVISIATTTTTIILMKFFFYFYFFNSNYLLKLNCFKKENKNDNELNGEMEQEQ